MPFVKLMLNSLVALMLTAACTTIPEDQLSDPVRDPNEAMNRAIFEFNTFTDKTFLRPIAVGYRAVMPEPVRNGVSNVFRNLAEPWTFVNDLLQGKPERAGTTLGRFLINSTLGLGGLFKMSDTLGVPYHTEDFGQTLAVWGVGQGSYFVVPFLGPSSIRDFSGFVVSIYGNPTNVTFRSLNEEGLLLGYIAGGTLEARARLHPTLEALYQSQDPYIFARSAYFQNRAYQIRDGKKEDTEEDDLFEGFDDDEGFE